MLSPKKCYISLNLCQKKCKILYGNCTNDKIKVINEAMHGKKNI